MEKWLFKEIQELALEEGVTLSDSEILNVRDFLITHSVTEECEAETPSVHTVEKFINFVNLTYDLKNDEAVGYYMHHFKPYRHSVLTKGVNAEEIYNFHNINILKNLLPVYLEGVKLGEDHAQ
jgi:hypothetical protein